MSSEGKPSSMDKRDSLGVARDVVHLESADPNPDGDSTSSQTDEGGKNEKIVRLKTDLFVLPLLASIYFLAQMGRSDLGNAKVAGLDEDFGLTPDMYSNVASIFIVGYLIFQLPGTLLLRRIGPSIQARSSIPYHAMSTFLSTVY